MQVSARSLLGLHVLNQESQKFVGSLEAVLMNPEMMLVDGYLLGRVGLAQNQLYLPRECVTEAEEHTLRAVVGRSTKKPTNARRILGLSAWTTHPKFFVGFVYDVSFDSETGSIDSFVIHQLLRTWRIPVTAVEKITPSSLLIYTDTTVKLKITPFPEGI